MADVRDGWVTLRGEADWRYQSRERRAGRPEHSGAKGVTNEINVASRPLIPAEPHARGPHIIACAGKHEHA
jgi:hypothetical protein